MLEIYRRAGEATRRRRADGSFERGYWANYFLRGVRRHGGPAYARQLLRASNTSTGFERLKQEGRLEIAMESLVLHGEFKSLFTQDELRVAAQRLKAAGYFPPAE
jgi:5-methylcytosine-specific restriction protein A